MTHGATTSRSRPHVVLGVSAGIAAYKACELLRRLTESGHDVTVVPTASALAFVGAPTWAALSGRPVATDVWTDVHEVPHVRIGQSADLVVVAPATADLLAKAAHGLADDLLTNTLLTARCPVTRGFGRRSRMSVAGPGVVPSTTWTRFFACSRPASEPSGRLEVDRSWLCRGRSSRANSLGEEREEREKAFGSVPVVSRSPQLSQWPEGLLVLLPVKRL